MNQSFTSHQFTDEAGNPAGGHSYGTGFSVAWQNGPLNRGEDRVDPNGAFVETIISVAADRLEFYQSSKFVSDYNAGALEHLYEALKILNARTADRESRDVEGTHAV